MKRSALRSLGYETDLFLAAIDGTVEERDRYLVVRTPSNPDFWWGNYLLYPEPPTANDHAVWRADFTRELPHARSILLAWDRPDGAQGDVSSFLDEGFMVDDGVVLTARAGDLRRPAPSDVVVRAVATDDEWEGARRALTSAFLPGRSGTEDDLRRFIDRQLERYRAIQERGLGQWYGAFLGDEVAAALGIIRDGVLGRFQLVGTDPRFARRGACSTLVHAAGEQALASGIETLVMAADATYHAARVYEGVGFQPTEHLYALIKKPARR